jgi:hypothetical protein
LSKQVAPLVQLPATHLLPAAQSESALQLALHAVAPHENGVHGWVTGLGQFPLPSHVAGNVCTPPVQLASRQETDEPTNAAHIVRSMPSQEAVAQTSASPPEGHFMRFPCGSPVTGAHVPSAPLTSQASH